ncbi:nucleoside hydrolase [Marinimicrococcus flavescens]|uniref:Nucleoside hydrolase n=1 Tax=Marinimicrococcus flavescens TaxID=3031815 RepID=A0AAP3XS58_9PROT|nr:nucleoside hydrolase [Marinimicrococcus flavescens]
MAPRAIILDCDPGQDDAVAILMALASPEALETLAITTVGGNVPLEKVTRNALQLAALAGRPDLPVHAGCGKPLLQPLVTAEEVHGESGLNGVELPPPASTPRTSHAVDAIIELVMARPAGTVTLCPTGPLTNIALAFAREPALAARIREIVLMGGARDLGNVTPAAEFNFYVDPEAARLVFESGVPITMFGLDVTHQVLVTEERVARIRGLGNRAGEAVAGFLDFYSRHDRERYGFAGGPLHDPCVIAHLLRPALFSGRSCHVAIDTESRLGRGRSLVDWWSVTGAVPNAMVMDQADATGFFELLYKLLGRLP